MEELHIELVVLHDQDGLGHPPNPRLSPIALRRDARAERLFTAPQSGTVQASPDLLRKGKWNPMKATNRSNREAAEMLAIQALGFMAGEPERLVRFLNMTG